MKIVNGDIVALEDGEPAPSVIRRSLVKMAYEDGVKEGRAEAFKECVEIVKSTYIDSNDPPLTCWQDKCVRNIEAAAKDKED